MRASLHIQSQIILSTDESHGKVFSVIIYAYIVPESRLLLIVRFSMHNFMGLESIKITVPEPRV